MIDVERCITDITCIICQYNLSLVKTDTKLTPGAGDICYYLVLWPWPLHTHGFADIFSNSCFYKISFKVLFLTGILPTMLGGVCHLFLRGVAISGTKCDQDCFFLQKEEFIQIEIGTHLNKYSFFEKKQLQKQPAMASMGVPSMVL